MPKRYGGGALTRRYTTVCGYWRLPYRHPDTLARLDRPEHRQTVERFAAWHIQRRLRRFADQGPVTDTQTQQARAEIRLAITGCSQDTDRSRHQSILNGDFRCSGGYGLSALGFDRGLNHESRHLIRAAETHSIIH
ncbi:MAG: hypothetical protein WCF33_01095 [Pseudonocardiaceae bacterium]